MPPTWSVTFRLDNPPPRVLLEIQASGILDGLVGPCLRQNAHQPQDHLVLCTYDPFGRPGDYRCLCLRGAELLELLAHLPLTPEQQRPWTPFLRAAAAAPITPPSRRCIFMLVNGDCVGSATLACAGAPVGPGAAA